MLDFENIVGFDWDDGNKTKNELKHEVTQKEAEEIFENEPFLTIKTGSTNEERFQLFGRTNSGRSLTVIFTLRQLKIRVISARPQSKKERSFYNARIKE